MFAAILCLIFYIEYILVLDCWLDKTETCEHVTLGFIIFGNFDKFCFILTNSLSKLFHLITC